MRKILESTLMVVTLAIGGWALSDDAAYRRVGSDEAGAVRGAACYTTTGTQWYCSFSCCYYLGPAIGTYPGPADLYNTTCSGSANCVLATWNTGYCVGT